MSTEPRKLFQRSLPEMIMHRLFLIVCLVFCLGFTGAAEAQVLGDRMYVGGSLGLGFGTVDTITVAPLIGFWITPELSAGAEVTFQYRNDSRFSPDLSTTDYGGRLFGRYLIPRTPVFAHLEYEYLSYEVITFDESTERLDSDGFFAGGGILQPVGGNAAIHLMALYNLSYDNDDPLRPYDSPWVYRVGVAFGF